MSDIKEWEIPTSAQPTGDRVAFDLPQALDAVVAIRTEVPDDAFTAQVLGTERAGSGVVIGDNGLVLTIGYLITEADSVWVTTNTGVAVPGHVVGYDQASGLGLVQALGRLHLPGLALGSAERVKIGDEVVLAGCGGRRHALMATVAGKREFAGYWEYLLDEAVFTVPAHPNWGGAACIAADGSLAGIGSLLIQHEGGDEKTSGNMIVPIDLLPPILDDLLRFGRVNRPARPWLGMFTADTQDQPVVVGLANEGPAERAGVQTGDVVLEVAGDPVDDLADMFRKVWSLGEAGVVVPLGLMRDRERISLSVPSADRNTFLKRPQLH